MRHNISRTDYLEASAGESAGSAAHQLAGTVADGLSRGKEAIFSAADQTSSSLKADLDALRSDLESFKETVLKSIARAGKEGARSVRESVSAVADRAGGVASDLATDGAEAFSAAAEHTKTAASDLETLARRNPFGTIGLGVLIGFLIGLMGRRG